MTRPSRGTLLWMVLIATAHPLVAQEPSIGPGDRVRIKGLTLTSQSVPWVVGTLESIRDSILVLRSDSGLPPREIRFNQIQRLEVHQGKKTNVVTGAVVGTLIGTTLGVVVGLIVTQDATDLPVGVGTLTAMGAGGGLVLGTLIGAASHSDRWVPASPERLRVSLMLNDRRPGLQLSLTW